MNSGLTEPGKTMNRTIRVEVEHLEQLMNLVGELVIVQNRIDVIQSDIEARQDNENIAQLSEITDHASRVISELQDRVMQVRMLPLDQLLNRFPRIVRDLSKTFDKNIELLISGGETELDRTVMEEIGEPMMQLIRHAALYGVESVEQRKLAGKPAKGRLQIAAANEGNQVVIVVEDDGVGIRDLAVLPSTLENVRLQVEKLNGIFDLQSTFGQGTRVSIRLPMTLSIIPGLLVKLSGRTFVIPMSSVVEIVRLPPESLQTIRGESLVSIRDRLLPVFSLHDYFNFPRRQALAKQLRLVVVGTTDRQMALMVDELIGNQEIVVKPLSPYVGEVHGLSGATILGDGQAALILEVSHFYHGKGGTPSSV
ncbi:hypothetical protein YSY43_12490 [Paenibacillus sp. YSY-4.3]